jgi:Kef-type K+ transport system membrane component KefB
MTAMDNIWLQSALWMALALAAAMGSLWVTISAALFEIIVGAVAGNTVGLPLTPWINYIASFGAIVLTFLAGTDIDPHVVKKNFASSSSGSAGARASRRSSFGEARRSPAG